MKKSLWLVAVVALILAGCEFFAPPVTYRVYYSANGGAGAEAPVDEATYEAGEAAAVKAFPAGLSMTEHALGTAWNTAADGTGESYATGASLAIAAADVTLFAQWTDLIVGEWTATQVNAFGMGIDIVSVVTIDESTYSIEYTVYYTTTTTLVPPENLGGLGMSANPQVIETGVFWRSWTHANIQPNYTGYYVLDREGDSAGDFVWYSTYFGTVEDTGVVGDDSDDTFTPVAAGNTLTMDDGGSVEKVRYTRVVP